MADTSRQDAFSDTDPPTITATPAAVGPLADPNAVTPPGVDPNAGAPASREQRLGMGRNSVYGERLDSSTKRVAKGLEQAAKSGDHTVTIEHLNHEEEQRKRQAMTLGLEVALAVTVMVARQVWGWVQEERARAKVDRELRRRLPA